VTAASVPHPRSEPLLWLQLIAFGAIPLEALLLLVLLAGADPGPVPALERLLVWGLGVLAPTLLLWRRPADCCSLLLVQVPLKARSDLQRRLAGLQGSLVPRLLLLGGAGLLLPAFWWLDRAAALAANSSPLDGGNRLVVLLLSIPLLALLLWQWHQLSQSLWLLSRSRESLAAAPPLGTSTLESQRLCLGIPLLLLTPLEMPAPLEQAAEASVAAAAVAVEPEQAAEAEQGSDLDQQIP
jgi:hypothetical protein